MLRILMFLTLLGTLGCASGAGRLVLTEDAIHDSLARVDDGVRGVCSQAETLLQAPCKKVRAALLPALEAGAIFNRSVASQRVDHLPTLFDALRRLGDALVKLPSGDTARWLTELSNVIAAAFNVTFSTGGKP